MLGKQHHVTDFRFDSVVGLVLDEKTVQPLLTDLVADRKGIDAAACRRNGIRAQVRGEDFEGEPMGLRQSCHHFTEDHGQ